MGAAFTYVKIIDKTRENKCFILLEKRLPQLFPEGGYMVVCMCACVCFTLCGCNSGCFYSFFLTPTLTTNSFTLSLSLKPTLQLSHPPSHSLTHSLTLILSLVGKADCTDERRAELYEVVERMTGDKLVGLKYTPIFPYFTEEYKSTGDPP